MTPPETVDDDPPLVRDRDGELIPADTEADGRRAGHCPHGRPRVADGTHTCTTCALSENPGRLTPPPPGWLDHARRVLAHTPRPATTPRREDHR